MIKERLILKEIEKYVDSPEAIILTGMRRTGKTTLLKYIYENNHSSNKLFLDMENPVNRKYFEEENYEKIKKAFEFLGIIFSSRSYVFIDEIQFVNNLPSVVKYFIDQYHVKFFLTGSASFYLKNLFSESLAGRKFIFELFPLTFREYLVFKDVQLKIPGDMGEITPAIFNAIIPFYEEYLFFGGFPQVVLKERSEDKKRAIEEIFTSFYQLEVLQLGDFRRNDKIRDLILLLSGRTGSKLDIQKLSRELTISRQTLQEYLSFLEGTFFFKTIRPYAKGINGEIRKMPKIYACDTGLINHFARVDRGNLFENSVFQNLRLKGDLRYFQRKSGAELDFILDNDTAYEVKITTHQSDISRIETLTSQLKLKDFFVVTLSYSSLNHVIFPFLL
jgi:predicted AAA+ superfamily ATPase